MKKKSSSAVLVNAKGAAPETTFPGKAVMQQSKESSKGFKKGGRIKDQATDGDFDRRAVEIDEGLRGLDRGCCCCLHVRILRATLTRVKHNRRYFRPIRYRSAAASAGPRSGMP